METGCSVARLLDTYVVTSVTATTAHLKLTLVLVAAKCCWLDEFIEFRYKR